MLNSQVRRGLATKPAKQDFLKRSQTCSNNITRKRLLSFDTEPPRGVQVDHPLPLSYMPRYFSTMCHGRHWSTIRPSGELIPNGVMTTNPAIDVTFFEEISRPHLPISLNPVAPGSPRFQRPIDRLMERLGSNSNPAHFLLLEGSIKTMKDRIEEMKTPMDTGKFDRFLRNAVNGGGPVPNPTPHSDRMFDEFDDIYFSEEESMEAFFTPLNAAVGVFDYLRDEIKVNATKEVVHGMYEDLQLIEHYVPSAHGIAAHWHPSYRHYFSLVSEFAQNWMTSRIVSVRQQYGASKSVYLDRVEDELRQIERKIPDMKYRFDE